MSPEVRLRSAFGEVDTEQIAIDVGNFRKDAMNLVSWHVIHELGDHPLSILLTLLPCLQPQVKNNLVPWWNLLLGRGLLECIEVHVNDLAGMAGDLADGTIRSATTSTELDLGTFGADSLQRALAEEIVVSIAIDIDHEMPSSVLWE